MPAKIVMKKFGVLAMPSYLDDLDKQDFQKRKTISFKSRFIKKIKTHKHNKRTDYTSPDNFKRNWFCKSCLNTFKLKPRRKYKTLFINFYQFACCT